MDAIFKALNDPHRRAILDALREEDGQTLGQIEARFAMTRFGVMAHLKVLEEAGLVLTRRAGRFKHHHLNALPLQEVLDRWIEPLLQKPAARAAIDLKTRLEATTTMTEKPVFLMATFIRCTPDALWDALTDPAKVPLYNFAADTARGSWATPGDAMEFVGAGGAASLRFRLLSMTPKSRIEATFEPHWAPGLEPSRCVYLIEPQGDACKLTIEHYGAAALGQGVSEGWPRTLSGLKTWLETGEPTRFPMPAMAMA